MTQLFGLDCIKCKKRKRDPFNLGNLCVICKCKIILKNMDKRYWALARSFNGVMK